EGYMDVIAVNQAGFENVVATLGTALTSEQARMIASYAKEVIIAFDSDEAGRTATNRAVTLLDEVGVKTRILNMTGAKDPDEYIKKFGRQRFQMLLDGANNVVEYQLSVIRAKYDLDAPDGKSAYLSAAAKYLSTVGSSIEREIYAGVLAKETGILKETILSNVETLVKRKFRKEKKKEWSNIQVSRDLYRDRTNPQRAVHLNVALAEEGILTFLYKNQDYYSYILQKIDENSFITDYNKEVFGIMLQKLHHNNSLTLMDFNPELSPDKLARFSGLLARQSDIQMTREALDDYIQVLQDYKYKTASSHASELTNEELLDVVQKLKEKKK
ncbi:MAG: toprim domain-containing protein, partial [Oscillospiraceae bacterium]